MTIELAMSVWPWSAASQARKPPDPPGSPWRSEPSRSRSNMAAWWNGSPRCDHHQLREPAGLITQAIGTHTGAKVVGICDTPSELFHQIAIALGEPDADVQCDYFGLNHLGWVRSVRVHGAETIHRILEDPKNIRRLYPAGLFPADLVQSLRLIPSEYLFFYYQQSIAVRNQLSAGATRGEELLNLNRGVLQDLSAAVDRGRPGEALAAYRAYLNRRNASYLRLEGAGQSAFDQPDPSWDPFEGETGYHRIAVATIGGLSGVTPHCIVLNVPNRNTYSELASEDVIELPCFVSKGEVRRIESDPLPDTVRGLVLSVKLYERLTIEAALQRSARAATLALFSNPIVADWDSAHRFVSLLRPFDA